MWSKWPYPVCSWCGSREVAGRDWVNISRRGREKRLLLRNRKRPSRRRMEREGTSLVIILCKCNTFVTIEPATTPAALDTSTIQHGQRIMAVSGTRCVAGSSGERPAGREG